MIQLEPADHLQDGFDMAVRDGFLRSEQVVWGDQGLGVQQAAEGLDFFFGPIGEIGQGALAGFLPSRQPSRRRMAGGELRLGTTAIYMRTLTNINPNLSREIYSYMRTQINENQVAVRAKPHIFKILTSNRASTVGWNFGLAVAGFSF